MAVGSRQHDSPLGFTKDLTFLLTIEDTWKVIYCLHSLYAYTERQMTPHMCHHLRPRKRNTVSF